MDLSKLSAFIGQMSKELKDEIQKGKNEMKEEMKKVQRGNDELKEELRKTMMAWREEKEKMCEEITNLKARVELLEEREEKRGKQEKRNNVIISGMQIKPEENLKKKVKDLCKSVVGSEVPVESVVCLGKDKKENDLVLVRFPSFNQKLNVMKKKCKLRNIQKAIYINDDLTEKEREIQGKIKEIAEGKRKEGKTVVIGYQKIKIDDGPWCTWTELSKLTGSHQEPNRL